MDASEDYPYHTLTVSNDNNMTNNGDPNPGLQNNSDINSASSPPVNYHHSAIHMSVSFCLMFLAFSVAQNFQTSSDHPSEGSIALGILYSFFTVSNIFSSPLVTRIGCKISLFIGAASYAIFVAANIQYQVILLYLSSAIIGIGAAVLWTAQGVAISAYANQHARQRELPSSSALGEFNGVFFSIFQVNQFLGNLLAAALFELNLNTSLIFVILTSICVGGVLSLLLLRPIPTLHSLYPPKSFSFRTVFNSLLLLRDLRLILLLPIIIYSGLFQGMVYSELGPLIDSRASKFYVFASFGLADAISSMVLGKVSDRIGRVPILWLGALAHMAVYGEMFADTELDASTSASRLWIYFLLAVGFGIGDAVWNTQLYSILATLWEGNTEHIFANFKLFQAASTAISLFWHDWLRLRYKTGITALVLVCGMAGITLCHQWFGVEKAKRKGPGEEMERVDVDEGDGSQLINSGREDELEEERGSPSPRDGSEYEI